VIVTTPATGRRAETEEQAERRMRTVAAELQAAGLDTGVYETRGVLDVRATLRREGCGPVEITYDDDGYGSGRRVLSALSAVCTACWLLAAASSKLRGVYPQDPDTNIYPENWYFVK
jgi:hypothetical protein